MLKWLISFSVLFVPLVKADLIKRVALPGQVQKITFEKPKSFTPTKVFCGTDEILFTEKDNSFHFFFAPSYFSNPGVKILCEAQDDKKENQLLVAELTVKEGIFDQEVLHVDQKTVIISKANLKRSQKERILLNKIYTNPERKQLFLTGFSKPLDSFITSNYGSRRLFNHHKKTQHLGTDFRAAVGENVKAANAGKVVMAYDLFFTGWTVIVDHGLGIFTIYAHMSEVAVKPGQMIEQGQILGKSGATGRVSGPHLHWGIKMNHQWVDGLSLIEASR